MSHGCVLCRCAHGYVNANVCRSMVSCQESQPSSLRSYMPMFVAAIYVFFPYWHFENCDDEAWMISQFAIQAFFSLLAF